MTDIVKRLRELRARAIQCKATPGEKEAAFDYGAAAMTAIPGLLDEIEQLHADLKEANEAIRELQQAACDRDGVPMPSQRSVVDKQRDEIEKLRASVSDGSEIIMELKQEIGRLRDLIVCKRNDRPMRAP